MSYNYGAPPGYGPPGMQAPPGMSAPPGMPGQQFQGPPPGMQNVNFNAPVIRMGADQQGKPHTPVDRTGGDRGARGSNAEPLGRNRMGLGAERDYGGRNLDAQRAAVRESMAAMTPPTREEVARTIFIGGIGNGAPDDDQIEEVLRCAGKLRRWTRAKDADDNRCKFGFAEYEDVDSLDAANEIFGQGIEVPVFARGGTIERESEGEEVKKMMLLVVVDEQSKSYISEWKGKQGEEDDARQFRLEACRDDLRANFASMVNQAAFAANAVNGEENGGSDVKMGEADGENADVVNIPVSLEDELADIPEHLRANVAIEIRAFRERSHRRDLENFRQEEEASAAARVNRLGSPPPGANGVPVGPRDRSGVQGAPSGPKGFRGAQLPNDYVNGVNFVSAGGANGYTYNREDEDAEESDDELERRRQAKREAELDKQYVEAERRWMNRERTRAAAQDREKTREAAERREVEREKDTLAARLREWDDDEEARVGRDEYYRDHSVWLRQRAPFRDREHNADERDRAAEQSEKAEERKREAEAKGMADDFLNQMDMDMTSRAAQQGRPLEPQQQQPGSGLGGFKISLGSAAQRAAKPQNTGPRRAMAADFENLLEDEEDAAASGLKRPELKPLTDTSTSAIANSIDMTDEERAEAKRSVASSIPTDTAELFAYPVKFNYLTPQILEESVKPFVEKKVVESLGVQEDLLVDAVIEALRERKEAKEVVGELEDALEEEAEGLVRKVWRMVVFLTECEGRGLT